MAAHLSQECDQGEDPFECPDNVIYWSPPFDEYGLIIHDGGASYIVLEHCPWCGTKLPESKRDVWFSELQGLGLHEPTQRRRARGLHDGCVVLALRRVAGRRSLSSPLVAICAHCS